MKADSPPAVAMEARDMVKGTTESIEDLKQAAEVHHGDYAGAVAKTDPVEIRLVRKLDWRIMVYDLFYQASRPSHLTHHL